MDMRVDAGRRHDQMRSRDCVSRQADFQAGRDAIHCVRIARLADAADATIFDADVSLHHTLDRVDDRHIGDHEVGCAARTRHLVVHAHAFAHALAAAEDDFVTVTAAQVALDLNKQTCVAQPDPIAGRGTE